MSPYKHTASSSGDRLTSVSPLIPTGKERFLLRPGQYLSDLLAFALRWVRSGSVAFSNLEAPSHYRAILSRNTDQVGSKILLKSSLPPWPYSSPPGPSNTDMPRVPLSSLMISFCSLAEFGLLRMHVHLICRDIMHPIPRIQLVSRTFMYDCRSTRALSIPITRKQDLYQTDRVGLCRVT